MKKLKLLISLLVMLISFGQCTSTGTLDIISKLHRIAESVKTVADSIQLPEEGDTKVDMDKNKLGDLLKPFKEICNQIDETEAQYSQYAKTALRSISKCVLKNTPLSVKVNYIFNELGWMSEPYSGTFQYELYHGYFELSTLIDMAEYATDSKTGSIPQQLADLHLALVGEDSSSLSDNFFTHLAQKYEESNAVGQSQQTTQQFLYTLYTDIALTQLKAYTLIESGIVILRLVGKEKGPQYTKHTRWDYGNRTEIVYKALRKAMEGQNRSVWRCDPKEHIPKVTYEEVTRLLQGYIENEVDLSSDGSCTETCGYYQNARSEGCFDSDSKFCGQQPKCSGNVYNCQSDDFDMTVCQAPSGSSRRYDYIQYDNGRVLGQSKKCERGTTNKVESWHRWIVQKCSYCFCLCDEQGPKSDRYFNLREAIADIEENKVVTGLRFVKKNRIFHLQIQQGKLMPRGVIDDKTLEWKPVDEYQITDANIVNEVDYHTMNYSSRSIDLDNIMNPNDNSSVVTGLRFRVLGSHLNLMAQICKFDFETGKLLQPKVNSVWQSNDNENREKLNLDNLDVPTRSFVKSLPRSKHNQYLDFVNSGIGQDVAQSTVPFIDIQDVVSNPPAPLVGIGIYYKSSPRYAGFVAPKIITYNFAPHVQVSNSSS
ncbi:uncharacterized protein LOC117789657 [Drosophila innubila]|uniref:uncharacterized protein LOC117789657 n=1 Tax=Drosophila innubila TaxID=198719 RepID=UPI00148E5767|nr:uncharacterized protein LOC117789657 [Drosophila innubila]